MRDESSINTELMEIQRVMGAYQIDVAEKEEKIKRLKKALSRLGNIKDNLYERKELCEQPEFTRESFYGRNANHIETYRDKIRQGFDAIPSYQISDAEESIHKKLRILEEDVTFLNS